MTTAAPSRRGPDLPYSLVAGVTPCATGWLVASAKLQGPFLPGGSPDHRNIRRGARPAAGLLGDRRECTDRLCGCRRNRGAGPVIERLGRFSDAVVRRSIPRRFEPVCKKALQATLAIWMPSRRSCYPVIARWRPKWPLTANAPSMRSTPSSASTSSMTMYHFAFPSSSSGGGKSAGPFWRRRSRESNGSSTRSSPMFRTPTYSMSPRSCGQRGASRPRRNARALDPEWDGEGLRMEIVR